MYKNNDKTSTELLFGTSLSTFMFCESTKISIIVIYAIRCFIYIISNLGGYERF